MQEQGIVRQTATTTPVHTSATSSILACRPATFVGPTSLIRRSSSPRFPTSSRPRCWRRRARTGAKSVVGPLIADKISGHDIDEVIWDPGYSLCKPETTTFPLTRAGISQTFQLVTSQRGIRPFSKEAVLLDGQLYSRLVPTELRDLVFPPRLSSGNWRLAYEDDFNRRARWRLVRHSAPNKDGVTRWRCPFCAGLLKSRNFPKTMRRPARVPMVVLDSEQHTCCKGTVSAPPVDLPLTQRIPFGSTAWRISMNRRMAVESVNAALKGGFVNVQRGFLASSAC